MLRKAVLFALVVAVCLPAFCLPAFAADTKVIVNGQVVEVPVVDVDGKPYVAVAALMKLLGGKVTYDVANGKLYINAAATAVAGRPARGGGAVSGTPQLPGDNGILDQVYTLGKDSPLYFRLKSAEYTVAPVVIGERIFSPAAKEKLLVLHFTVQNPNKTDDRTVRWDSLNFSAFDADNATYKGGNDWGKEDDHDKLEMSLKPAQTVEGCTVINVPAKGQMAKLMVQSGDEDNVPVLRYDLTDKVDPLQPPFADPADASGATALLTIPAEMGTAYPLTDLAVTVEKIETTTAPVQQDAPPEGGSFAIATLLIKNLAPTDTFVRWDEIQPVLTSTDGAELRYVGMVTATSSQDFSQNIKPGAEARARIYFEVPQGATPKTLSISQDESRSYQWEAK